MKDSLKGKNILIYGLGKSGLSAYELLKGEKANLFTYDDEKFPNKELNLDIKKLDYVVVSPGISQSQELYKKLVESKVKIISEIELGHMFLKGKVIAITGTNGKTTTVSLLGHIFKQCESKFLKNRIFVAGNVGIPLSKIAKKTNKKSTTIVEVSSFQLEKIIDFHANIASVLNIAPDHLDRYESMESYIQAKAKIFENQNSKDIAILNYNEKHNNELFKKSKSNLYYFSINNESENEDFRGTYLKNNSIYFKDNQKEFLMNTNKIKLVGKKNLENVLVAILISKLSGLNMNKVERAINSFEPLANRLEVVKKDGKITYINDSKATNIASAIADLDAVEGSKIVLFGGSDKGENFIELAENLNKSIKKAVIFGKTAEKIENSMKKIGFKRYLKFEKFEEAVIAAKELAKVYKEKGEEVTVILSPACASFDEFENYVERGKAFKKLVLF